MYVVEILIELEFVRDKFKKKRKKFQLDRVSCISRRGEFLRWSQVKNTRVADCQRSTSNRLLRRTTEEQVASSSHCRELCVRETG